MSGKKKTCFVISPIGAEGSEERKRADRCLKYIFKASLEPLGYSVIRADEISETGSITHQVLGRVTESELVIADLTDHNPNVFYELAVRDTIARPVIRVIKAGQRIPFDVADLRTISIDLDVETVESAKSAIAAQAAEVEAGNLGTTPVKIAGVLRHLESDKSEEKIILRQVIDGMSELRTDLRLILDRNQSALSHNFYELRNLLTHQRPSLEYETRTGKDPISEGELKDLIARELGKHGISDVRKVVQAMREILPQLPQATNSMMTEFHVESAVADWVFRAPKPTK